MAQKLALLYFLVFSTFCFAQTTKMQKEVQSLIRKKPLSIESIHSVFKNDWKNKEALELLVNESKKASYLQGLYYGSNALGRYYRDLSLFDLSVVEYKKALKISISLADTVNQVKTLNSMGSVYRRQDAIINALNYHKEALDLGLSVTNPSITTEKGISVSQNSIGNIYLSLKQYKLALAEFKKSIVIQKKLNHQLGQAINYQNIGNAHDGLGNLQEALVNYQKSLDFNNQIDSKIGKVICGYSIANVLIKQGRYKKAFSTVNEILPIALKENDKYYLSNTYNTIGLSQIYLNDLSNAKENLSVGLKIASKFNVHQVIVKANQHLALLHEKKNEHKKAYLHYKKAKEEDDKTFNARNLIYVRDLITEYDKERAENQIASLAKQNQIAQLKINRNWNLWVFFLSLLILMGVVVLSIFRQKSLKNEKKVLSLKQDALRSQMNPHFLFNALNSIKLYIINNDKKKAASYLNKFSKLMRKILEASSLQEIYLVEEIETMKLYMSIENIRFSNEIDFSVNIDSSINLNTIKIPPLVLQPFLENSLWHGLSSKKEKGKITLSIERISSEFIQIDIEDNGIGRAASAKIKAKKSIKRKSIGIDLTKNRLKTFVKNLKNDFSLKYIDLKGDNDEALGTKVSLIIPLS
jgi:tetratricopeptide (TPR) repeat protein